jgi:ATP-dependent Clp protease adaptor protein ClpS
MPFELDASYVSFAVMNWRPRRGAAVVAPGRMRNVRDSLHGTKSRPGATTLNNPQLEEQTLAEEAVDLPWQVVVHNDPVNLMTYVTMVFQKVFGYPREKAERHMLEVHQQGRSILWSGVRERAELYVQQLHGYLLLATLERIS